MDFKPESYKAAGVIIEIYDEEQKTEKFKVREFVIQQENEFGTNYVKFQLNNAKTELMEKFGIGNEVVVTFNCKGIYYTDKMGSPRYITNLVAWNVQDYADHLAQVAANAQRAAGKSYPNKVATTAANYPPKQPCNHNTYRDIDFSTPPPPPPKEEDNSRPKNEIEYLEDLPF